jgi:nucleotide-binding universal stress UspA family protein
MGFRKIMCPVDFSPGSRAALTRACELARESGAALVLAHVWEPSPWTLGGEVGVAPAVIQDMVDAEEAELAKWRIQAKDLGAKEIASKFLTGAAWDQIVRAAEADPDIDLVVMGTHGRTGLRHALLGSVAEKVVRHAPCAVLVVRARPEAP